MGIVQCNRTLGAEVLAENRCFRNVADDTYKSKPKVELGFGDPSLTRPPRLKLD